MTVESHGVYDELARQAPEFARRLHRRSGIVYQDCEQLVQDQLLATWSDEAFFGRSRQELATYINIGLDRRVTDLRRERVGQGKVKRSHASFDELAVEITVEDAAQAALFDAEHQMVLAAFRKLPLVNRDALRDRYHHKRSVADCAQLRGLSKPKFVRLFRDSLDLMRTLLAAQSTDICLQTRLELSISSDTSAVRDRIAHEKVTAHLKSECPSCRAYEAKMTKGKHRQGLMTALPAVGLLQRMLHRLPGLSRHRETLGGAVQSVEAASAGGSIAIGGAGSAVMFGAGAKTVAIGACALMTAGACLFGGHELLVHHPKKPKPVASDAARPQTRTILVSAVAPHLLPQRVVLARSGTPSTQAAPAAATHRVVRKAKRHVAKRHVSKTARVKRPTRRATRLQAATTRASPAPAIVRPVTPSYVAPKTVPAAAPASSTSSVAPKAVPAGAGSSTYDPLQGGP